MNTILGEFELSEKFACVLLNFNELRTLDSDHYDKLKHNCQDELSRWRDMISFVKDKPDPMDPACLFKMLR